MKRFYLKRVNIVLRAADSSEGSCQQEQKQRQSDPQQPAICQQAEALAQKLRGQFTVVMSCEWKDATEYAVCEGTLWLTDCPDIARQLTDRQLPVMVWLHEGNRQHSFPEIRYAVENPQELDADFYDKIYRRFAGIPWEIAETKRCIIRETTVDDVDSFVKIYQEPGITRYTDAFCIEPHKEREHVKEYIEKVYEFLGFGVWTVLWKETGEVIGRVGFEQPYVGGIEGADGKDEELLALGYMVARPWQGKGIAQEVCRTAIDFAKEELGVRGVQVLIDVENLPSLRIAEKLGFLGDYIESPKGREYFRGILHFS